MKKYLFILFFLFTSTAYAQTVPSMNNFFFEQYQGDNLQLTQSEKEALTTAQKWQKDNKITVQGHDGTIRFLYGATQPTVVCAIMQITDIEFEAGESINSLHLGDTVRWLVEPAITGMGENEIQHIVIKPMDVGLETSLFVTTSLRTYHIRLVSHQKEYMPRVSFIYPSTTLARFETQKKREMTIHKEKTIPETGEYLGDLDFEYEIKGNGIKPLRVYNDGTRTIIQIPKTDEIPTLLILRDDEEVLTNYRFQGDRYIVDSLFEKAILIIGVGRDQKKTVITKE